MKNWKTVNEIEVTGKNIIARVDLEWPTNDCPREKAAKDLVKYLKDKGAAKIKVIGHKGHWITNEVEVTNDLRADPREETDDTEFARELGEGFDVYINEAFATSHRRHTSIDALPRWMKEQDKEVCIGMRFAKEIEVLTKVLSKNSFPADGGTFTLNKGRAIRKILVIGGAKASDKEKASVELTSKFDAVLKGGLLSGVKLRPDGLDLADETIVEYVKSVSEADLVLVAGPMGKFEDETAEKGTKDVYTAAADSKAFKIAGGGDTEAALDKFGLTEKFDWISVGGGAMLEFLVNGTLPGLDALIG